MPLGPEGGAQRPECSQGVGTAWESGARFEAEEEAACGDLEADTKESWWRRSWREQGGRLDGETAEAALERPAVSISEEMQALQTEHRGDWASVERGSWGVGTRLKTDVCREIWARRQALGGDH